MQTPFDHYANKGNEVLAALAHELMLSHDKPRALHIMKAVFHGIRNRITLEESTHFVAQLPMMLKAIYVDGWSIGKHSKRIDTFDEFVEEVYQLGGGYRGLAFGDLNQVEFSIKAVLKILKHYVSDGEFNDMLATMPKDLQSKLLDYLMHDGGVVM